MTTSPPRIIETAREQNVRTLLGLAVGISLGFASTGSPIVGTVIGTFVLGCVGVQPGWVHRRRMAFFLQNLGWVVFAAVAGYVGHDVLANWADFKQGVVEGWNAV